MSKTELLKMLTENGLLVEPHNYRRIDFKPFNPEVSEILKSGIEIQKFKYGNTKFT